MPRSKTDTGKTARLGVKVRALRRRESLTQAQLAKRLGISASYLNLIENDKRPLTAPLLIKLAQEFDVDLSTFAAKSDANLIADLMEVFGDPVLENEPLTNTDVRELCAASPSAARAVLTLYQDLQATRANAQVMAARLADDDASLRMGGILVPSEEVSDFLQKNENHFPILEDAAERLWREAGLSEENLYAGLVGLLEERLGIRVEIARGEAGARAFRVYEPNKKRLTLSERLPPRSRNFQLAHQIGLLTEHMLLDRLVEHQTLTTDESRALARVALASYFAGAVLMPYGPFIEAAQQERYDVELLGHRFRTSFEQVCHRLCTLSRPGAEGIPFHMLRVDVAGNISKRYSGSGIRFARYSGACPRWNVFSAFSTPGMLNAQISVMPDGVRYFCIARTVKTTSFGHGAPSAQFAVGLGCEISHAEKMVYADRYDLEAVSTDIPVGVTCRLCERLSCPQRAFPPLNAPLHVDENARGLSFYVPAK